MFRKLDLFPSSGEERGTYSFGSLGKTNPLDNLRRIIYSYANVVDRGKSKEDNRKFVMKHVQTWNVCFFISSHRIRSITL
jgi:hypothetical protein